MSLTMAMVHDAISIIWFCYELMIFSNKCKIVSFFLCVFSKIDFLRKKFCIQIAHITTHEICRPFFVKLSACEIS